MVTLAKENFRGQSKYLLCWRNEGNFSVLSSNLFSCDASRTMSAGGGSEKWPKFVHFCLALAVSPWAALHPPCCKVSLAHPCLMIDGGVRAAMPPQVGPDFKEGGDSFRLWTISCSCMIVNQGWKKVQKWETNGLINAACGNQCSFRGCELGEWLVIVVLWLQVGWRNWGHAIHLKHQSKFKWRHAVVKILWRHLKTQDRQIHGNFLIPK